MINREIRDYEISLWTLQDEFITVLKPSGFEHKAQTQNAEMKLNIDGTQELSFDIPMYLYINGEKKENPAWYNAKNNSIVLTGMRKIKVIINKKTEDEEIFEFVIVKVKDKHENDELICSIECEGLAFHELGKTGFKVSLTEDVYYNEHEAWENARDEAKKAGLVFEEEEPFNNLQYWLNKFLLTEDQVNSVQQWYYTINMDWSSHDNAGLKSSKIIYENPYIASYNFDTVDGEIIATPARVEDSREKGRLVNLEESNRYNLTQDLAEAFEVYCRYIYHHDENYYITGREVQFYNNYFGEDENAFDLTYRFNSSSISRESDSTELVTKMYVKTVEIESDINNQVSIIDVDANLSGEDYILNFDYLRTIGGISEEVYAEVKKFETAVGAINRELKPISNIINVLSNRINELEAEITTLTDAATLEQTQYDDINKRIDALTNGSGERDKTNPYPALRRKDNTTGFYYVDLSQDGVLSGTVKVYPSSSCTSGTELTFTEGKDEYGYVERLYNLPAPTTVSSNVYITYKYTALEYLQHLLNEYAAQGTRDLEKANEKKGQQNKYQILLEQHTNDYNAKIKEKNKLIADFENLMGPALREGYWQPEEFHDYGDYYSDSFELSDYTSSNGQSGITELIWDTARFDNEEELYETIGIAGGQEDYYLCISLTSDELGTLYQHKDELNALRVFFPSSVSSSTAESDPRHWSAFGLNSECEFGFIKNTDRNLTYPVIILTGENTLSSAEAENLRTAWTIGRLDYIEENNTVIVNKTAWINYNGALTIDTNHYYKRLYPRIKVKSDKVKIGDNNLYLSLNNNKLEEYNDYQVLVDDTFDESNFTAEVYYYITLKPESMIKYLKVIPLENNNFNYQLGKLDSKITVSNVATAIYLDALTVSKDSAYPQVSYEIDVNVFNKEFIKKVAGKLGHIAHINDHELKFDHVLGYISELTLNLDKPWEDSIEIKNYKTKFEDLFQKIVAQTESMKKQSYLLNTITQAFTANGEIKSEIIQKTFTRADLNYAFNQGALTINETNGIWGTSDQGVVAFRGGGIFTATQKDAGGNWVWNTGILPSGIDASAIKTGQLDTNRINIYAGDDLHFQWNGDGIFAYKDININSTTGELETSEYVKYNSEGLMLIQTNNSNDINSGEDIKRVEIGWDGLTLRNKIGTEIFKADDTSGNLIITGDITATSGTIGAGDNKLYIGTQTYSGVSFGYIGNASNYLNATLGFRALPSDQNWASLWIGGTTTGGQYPCNNAPFRVMRDGTLYASNVNITGGMLSIGSKFSVNSSGILNASGAIISGTITSNNATITDGSITIPNGSNDYTKIDSSGIKIEIPNSYYARLNYSYLTVVNKSINNNITYQNVMSIYPEMIEMISNENGVQKKRLIIRPNQITTYTGSSVTIDSLTVSQIKARIVQTSQYSDRLLYCYETPTPMFGDIGEGIIGQDGLCYISFDSVFAQTVITDQYQVFLQPYGEGNCWIKTRTSSWFVVEGTPGLKFGWEVKAKQRDYDQLRLEKYEQDPYTIPEQTYGIDAANYIDELRQGRITQ